MLRQVVGVQGGARVVVANGRLLGPLDQGETFQLEDFALLEKYSASSLTDKITEIVKGEPECYAPMDLCLLLKG